MKDLLMTRAERFIRLNARPLELARFEYHFCGGAADPVLCAMAVYQNADGGFGSGLEPDTMSPHSSPYQTWQATEYLREIGCTQASAPVVAGLLEYLSGTDGFDGIRWRFTMPKNNDFPHAPWMYDNGASCTTFNPTASLAGFLLRYAPMNSLAYARAVCSAKAAISDYLHRPQAPEMHVVRCFVQLYEDCRAADLTGVDLNALAQKLHRDAAACIETDTAKWGTKYCCLPSWLVTDRSSILYPDFAELIAQECAFLADTQNPDGSWNVTWRWVSYPDEWAVAKLHWKSIRIVNNLLFLKKMGNLHIR